MGSISAVDKSTGLEYLRPWFKSQLEPGFFHYIFLSLPVYYVSLKTYGVHHATHFICVITRGFYVCYFMTSNHTCSSFTYHCQTKKSLLHTYKFKLYHNISQFKFYQANSSFIKQIQVLSSKFKCILFIKQIQVLSSKFKCCRLA